MLTQQQLTIHRTANFLNGEQAYLYALGAESWVKRILWRDAKEVDHLQEEWATFLPPLPILGGHLQGRLEDLQGRFNLNNLVLEGQPSLQDVALFERLLTILELPPQWAQVIVDWIDPDNNPQIPDGAEETTYLAKTPAYRTANTLLSSPSELRLLAGVDKESYQKLWPHICTLPTRTLINVNTVSLPLLRALVEGLNAQEAAVLLADRQQQPFHSVRDFLVHKVLAGLRVETDRISVSSEYFLFTAQVEIDKTKAHLSSLLHRWPDRVEVVMRSQGGEL